MPEYVEDLVVNFDEIPRWVLDAVKPDRFTDSVRRALEAGAGDPLTWMGTGATGTVFCDDRAAYKVAHTLDPGRLRMFEDEAEWLTDARELDLPVAEVYELHRDLGVIERECIRGRAGAWAGPGELWHVHQEILRPAMATIDWGMPEFKEDSYVDGILVDASAPPRLGSRMAEYAEEVIAGPLGQGAIDPHYLALEVMSERGAGRIPEWVADDLVDRIHAWGRQ